MLFRSAISLSRRATRNLTPPALVVFYSSRLSASTCSEQASPVLTPHSPVARLVHKQTMKRIGTLEKVPKKRSGPSRSFQRLPRARGPSLAELQQMAELKDVAELCYKNLTKAGADFETATLKLCNDDGANLRAMLVGGNIGDKVTVKHLWEKRAKVDPLCKHLCYIEDGDEGRIVPKILTHKGIIVQSMLDDFESVLQEFDVPSQERFYKKGKISTGLINALNGVSSNSPVFLNQKTGGVSGASRAQLFSMITDCISQCRIVTERGLPGQVGPPSMREKKVSQNMALIARDRYFRCDLNHLVSVLWNVYQYYA